MKYLFLMTIVLALTSCSKTAAFFTLISTESFDTRHFNADAPFLEVESKRFNFKTSRTPISPLEAAIMKLHVGHGGDMLVNAELGCENPLRTWTADARIRADSIKMYGMARPAEAIKQSTSASNSAYQRAKHTTQNTNSSTQNLRQIRDTLNSARDAVDEGKELYNEGSSFLKDIKNTLKR